MQGNPSDFEAIGSRLGFQVESDGEERLSLVWHGARFPALLCLGIAIALLFLSIPILEAIRQSGFRGRAASLWYFPLMNLILLGIAVFLLSLKRTILFDRGRRKVSLAKRSLFRTAALHLAYDEVAALRLGFDRVYSGFAVAGSSAAQKYPVPSLRLVLENGGTVLLDRGGIRRLKNLSERVSAELGKPLETDEDLVRFSPTSSSPPGPP